MGKSKSKKKLKQGKSKITIVKETEASTNTKVPIHNLPEKFLWMHVKSGTKIRNVLGYALKEFPSYDSIVWTGFGQAIMKTISCAEIFKKKHEGLHQVTKLRYVNSEKSKDTAVETRRMPEIHILLTKDIKDTTELGYQAPGDCGRFSKNEGTTESKAHTTTESTSDVKMIITTEGTDDVETNSLTEDTNDVKAENLTEDTNDVKAEGSTEDTNDVKAEGSTEDTNDVKANISTENTDNAKTNVTTESTDDVPCIDKQFYTTKKRKKHKEKKNAESPSKKNKTK